ncbi:prepilin-type N-terminal cleavage/methylation domain-containing protein [Photobacterium sp. GJ3]|uniref:type IV pilus modification PilV family protein n=1 Tax=Photobacterium sp. GJ3 TaxID=2829502 RepID=UPI001B8D990E|nr:prepilin-type N-terminal cleavage/methylation domain-containing protein [Photobacterium sp. GJ3]QUJ67141.1 prepilin-type N-terminal cleavage/methylation domain-containing protein [Photobacterium sp. GJ3]
MPVRNLSRFQRGFTLIEGILAIVIMAIAMVTLVSFLFPQAEQSAVPQYQARAAAIGQGALNEILARKFDEHSDPFNDSVIRCGESGYTCSEPDALGRDTGESNGTELNVAAADDVDDFIGCWGSAAQCGSSSLSRRGALQDLVIVSAAEVSDYRHIWLEVRVGYEKEDLSGAASGVTAQKRIEVLVKTTRYGDYAFMALRSNY